MYRISPLLRRKEKNPNHNLFLCLNLLMRIWEVCS